jgi:hypothetical protein
MSENKEMSKVVYYDVTYYKGKWDGENCVLNKTKEVDGRGKFLQFGTGCIALGYGAGTFSTALIELEDGTVVNIPAQLIKFV